MMKSNGKIKSPVNPKPTKKSKFKVQTLTGMHDYLPAEARYWDKIYDTVRELANCYGFGKIVTPLAEQTDLIIRSVGESSDIVQKETYTFVDKSGESITLRPEMTASIARAYIEHGMVNLPQPVKLWSFGPCFRHERPQAGRYRQFFQFDLETLGSDLPVVDAEIIMMASSLLREIGLESELHINSIGKPAGRAAYYDVLHNYLRPKKKALCENCQKRLTKNPLRLFDCKEKRCQEIMAEAPQLVDHLDEESREHFVKVLEHLDEADIPYTLDPKLVRGLDYYTKTVFEFVAKDDTDKRMNALVSGGRYDGLVEYLGGRPTPACGLAGGIERLVMKMKAKKLKFQESNINRPLIFLAQIGESARKRSLRLFEDLRRAGIKTAGDLVKQGLKTQLATASKQQVLYTLILGQKEIVDKTIILRDMENGSQEVINYEKIIPELQKRLEHSDLSLVRNMITESENNQPEEKIEDLNDGDITEDLSEPEKE